MECKLGKTADPKFTGIFRADFHPGRLTTLILNSWLCDRAVVYSAYLLCESIFKTPSAVPENISAICDDASILHFRYMLLSKGATIRFPGGGQEYLEKHKYFFQFQSDFF